jgi:hypothetical protein
VSLFCFVCKVLLLLLCGTCSGACSSVGAFWQTVSMLSSDTTGTFGRNSAHAAGVSLACSQQLTVAAMWQCAITPADLQL